MCYVAEHLWYNLDFYCLLLDIRKIETICWSSYSHSLILFFSSKLFRWIKVVKLRIGRVYFYKQLVCVYFVSVTCFSQSDVLFSYQNWIYIYNHPIWMCKFGNFDECVCEMCMICKLWESIDEMCYLKGAPNKVQF